MQKLPFRSVSVYVCVSLCMRGKEFLIQGFISHSLEVVNNVILKTCEVLPSGMIQSHCICIKLCPLYLTIGVLRIFDIAWHFAFILWYFKSTPMFCGIMKTHTVPPSTVFVVLRTWIVAEKMSLKKKCPDYAHFPYLPSHTRYVLLFFLFLWFNPRPFSVFRHLLASAGGGCDPPWRFEIKRRRA